MAHKRLTTALVEKIQPPTDKAQEDYFDTLLPAFGLRVGRQRKSYFVMVRTLNNGKWKLRRVTLGTTAELDLPQARDAARKAMQRAEQGKDPTEVKRDRRTTQEAESRNTFAAVRAEFLQKYRTRQKRRPSERTLAELTRVLNHAAFKDWSSRPMTEVAQRDVMDAIDEFVSSGYETAANRYLTYLKMFFGWSLDRDIIKTDPTDRIKPPGAEHSRERVLDLDEMAAIWHATAPTQQNKGDLFACIVKVLMLTGQRRNEVAGMRWSELDLDRRLWSIPKTRTKNKRDHLVPLSEPIIDILRERQQEQKDMRMKATLVFTTTGETAFSGWSRSKKRLDGRANTAPWTLHDLRRTLVTRMAEDLHILPHAVEAVVNHVSGVKAGVAGVYNRALYLDQRREALTAWADYILRLVGEIEPDNVVPIREARQ